MEGSSSKGAAHQTRLCADQGAEDGGRQHNMRRPTCTSSIFVERAMYSEAGSDPHRTGVASAEQRWKAAEGGQWEAGSRKWRAVMTSVEQQCRDADSVQRTEGGLGSSEPVTAVLPQKEQENCGKIPVNGERVLLLLRATAQLQEPVEPVNSRGKPRNEPGWCIDQSKEQRSGGRANGSKQKGCW
ncbi:hypothetical protein B0H14DRAFT_2652823 [Mycena olivaceomarginata]|nr:hypothetical protein B0H14DRAFT_2652823 [Mycena olivaceomarginata]